MYALSTLTLVWVAFASGRIQHTNEEVELDGRLDEGAWAGAAVHRLGNQKQPKGGAAPSVETTWRAVVVGGVLYVGIEAEAGEYPIIARRTRRDRYVESDRVTVDIDTRGRGQDAFHFEVTAGGSLVDGIRYNDTTLDTQWDAPWNARVWVGEHSWSAEFAIPLRLLRRPPGATGEVHMQVRRYVSALGELDEWSPTRRDGSREVSEYLPVEGLSLQARRLTLDLLPYMSIGTTLQTPEQSSQAIQRYGGDAKLQVGSDFSVDMTVLPDFGTVEADTAVFNLSPVEVRFPEKRPFFLEGTDIFATPFELFYSRRIGSLSGTTTGTAIAAPPPARVLGAAKMLARVRSKWSFGGLVAGSEAVEVPVRDTTVGVVARQEVTPGVVYGVLRARRELPAGGHVGLMGTTRGSIDHGPEAPFLACPDGAPPVAGTCFADTFAAGPDLRLRTPNGKWVATAQAIGTARHGGSPLTYPDGGSVESGDIGAAANARVEKTGGRVIGYLNYEFYGRNADWNATGYLPRPNHHWARAHLGLQQLSPHGPVREDRWQAEVFQRFALDGTPMGSGYQFNHRAIWNSRWESFVELHYRPHYFDNREARDGTPVERIGLAGLELEVASDPRRIVTAGLESTYQQRWNGPRLETSVFTDLNVLGPLQVRLGVDTTVDRGEPRWVDTDVDAGVYRLARLYATAVGFVSRINYTITPRLELQLYGQLLGVGTDYRNGFTAPIGVDRIRLDELVADPSFRPVRETEALLVGNLFLRWEYTPGSNLYLVFTRNQLDPLDPAGQGRLEFGSIGRNQAAYTFMVKTTMLLGV